MKRKLNIIDDISIKMLTYESEPGEALEQMIFDMINSVQDLDMQGRDGRTLLIHASLYNMVSVVKYLLSRNVSLTVTDDLGYTALHAAADRNRKDIIELLLANGADINARNNWGMTPLLRVSHLHTDTIELLLANGADATIPNDYGVSAEQAFQAYPHIIELINKYKGANK